MTSELVPHAGGAKALLSQALAEGETALAWLGQAGFLIRHNRHRLLIDPYLSDYLARKYAGTEFPHVRLMRPPVAADDLLGIDWVLCSHRHSDHMDPDTLPWLERNNPQCRFVVPRAELPAAAKIGLEAARLVPVNAGEEISLSKDVSVEVVAAAHENMQVNERGEHSFLGFIIHLGSTTLYHSGDSVVYPGLVERLRKVRIDLALLPINGRSPRLAAAGFAGNMNFDEARRLCLTAGIGLLMPHHFGMFAFNTANPAETQKEIDLIDSSRLRCVLPAVEQYYSLNPT
jgi:L-ascorbate metabolism protein UlaG (beta-lactamase superfamily)